MTAAKGDRCHLRSKPRTRSETRGCWKLLKPELPRVLAALRLPERCILDNRAVVLGQTVLLVSLFTLSYPRTQGSTAKEFGFADQTEVSRILGFFRLHVTETFGHLLQPANDDDEGFSMWARFIRLFQSRIFAVSEHEDYADVAMFTDGTFRPSCRPAQRQEDFDRGLSTQRRVYSGYKKRHGLSFQGTMTPCGLFASMHGAFTGRRADGFVFRCVNVSFLFKVTRAQGYTNQCQGRSPGKSVRIPRQDSRGLCIRSGLEHGERRRIPHVQVERVRGVGLRLGLYAVGWN
jgi:hypothetical protein